jgi:hypothetical protein
MRKPKDWDLPCPNPDCPHYRRMQQGNVSAIATYLTHSGKRRIFRQGAQSLTHQYIQYSLTNRVLPGSG